MAVFNTFTFDGENSLDYGVYITGEAVYNAPERAVEMVSIPGKNGALALDQGRFENIEVTYPAGMFEVKQAEFAGRMRAMRNMLASRYNYVRLTDSYHPDEYRLGLYKSGLEATPVAMNSAGEFDITFNCKPQRFLTSGEKPVDTSELGGDVTTDKIPYLFRRSGGGNVGHDFDAEIDKIIGGTVAWSQLVQNGNFADGTNNWGLNGEATLATSNNTLTITASARISGVYQYFSIISGHKYLWHMNLKSTGACYVGMETISARECSASNSYQEIYGIGNAIVSGNVGYIIYSWVNEQNVIDVKDVTVIDLTVLFGSAEIADYVYSLEQTTAGAGVAWLKAHGFLTKDYYAYNKGSLLSVKTSEHRTSGKNLLPNEITTTTEAGLTYTTQPNGKIKITGTSTGSIYQTDICTDFSLPVGEYVLSYDSAQYLNVQICNRAENVEYLFVGPNTPSKTFTVTNAMSNDMRVRFIANSGRVINAETGVMIRIASVSDATFEPYQEPHSYPLDSDLELRGLFKLDANNNLYAEGDVYESSGAVSRKYRIVTYDGSENWGKEGAGWQTSGLNAFYLLLDPYNGKSDYINLSNLICDKFINASYNDLKSGAEYGVIGMTSGGAYIELLADFSSVSDFKTWLASNPITVVYELEAPTTETADPYANQQIVSPLGTEEYVDERNVPVPVGHETRYGMSQLVLSNPTEFPSKPLLEVTGVGTFWLGDTLFIITGTAGQTIYIDCETGEAWKNVGGIITPANGLVSLNRLDFPELDPGDTPVMYGTGITKVVVTPRWWII